MKTSYSFSNKLIVTIKDSNRFEKDKKGIKQREKDQMVLAEKIDDVSILERLNEIKKIENNLKSKEGAART